MPSKARNGEKTQRSTELDEFSINQATRSTDTLENKWVSAIRNVSGNQVKK